MSSNFGSCPLSELLAIKPRNGLYKSKEHQGRGHRWVKMSNIYGSDFLTDQKTELVEINGVELDKFGCVEGDLLFGRTSLTLEGIGDCLLVGPIDDQPVFESNLFRIRFDQSIASPLFYFYYFKSKLGKSLIQTIAKQTAATSITSTDLIQLQVPYPELELQESIARKIFILDQKIATNHQINQALEQMAQAIFKSWLVDFEPVKAKITALEAGGSEEDALLATMQAISGKGKTELTRVQTEQPEQYAELRATAELFPSGMQDSELGEIPEGWAARPFGELLEKTIGGDWGKDEPDEKHTEMVKILRGTDLPNVYAGDDRKVPTRYVESKKLKTRGLKPADIVIEISGGSKGQPTGRSLFLTPSLLDRLGVCEPASFCRLFRPKDEATGLLLGLHLQHIYAEGKTWLYQNQSTGISNFQTKIFLDHELVVTPSAKVIRNLYERVIPLINRIHGDESAVLADIRDALLPKLLSGELSVSGAEDQLAEVVETADV